MKIGFIGQGWIGKNYADDFEKRGYEVVRYALEEPYTRNKDAISACDMVFIAVPTPTTPKGFDFSILRSVLPSVGKGKIAIVKSTIQPGTTELLQNEFPDIYVFHSPEFLVEKTAAFDAAHPNRNIIGIPRMNAEYDEKARLVLSVLPEAPYSAVLPAKEAEFVKYAGNCFLYTKVLYMNLLHELVTAAGADWELIRTALINDPRIGTSHTNPVHSGGRGAGGHCFIKDFEAFRRMYAEIVGDTKGNLVLESLMHKNNQLLLSTNKDRELLEGVYGDLAKFEA